MTTTAAFLQRLAAQPDSIQFNDTIALIDAAYAFTPTGFTNGEVRNEAGQNNGSCKIFAFGLLHQLPESQLLACFGDYYRKDVLGNPAGTDHQNIRNFMKTGWGGIRYDGPALQSRND
jgi:hypothetical protein